MRCDGERPAGPAPCSRWDTGGLSDVCACSECDGDGVVVVVDAVDGHCSHFLGFKPTPAQTWEGAGVCRDRVDLK